MNSHKIIVLETDKLSSLGQTIVEHFAAKEVTSVSETLQLLTEDNYRAVVFDCVNEGSLNLGVCQELLDSDVLTDTPLVVITEKYTLDDKLAAFEIGCDDFFDTTINGEEACARITKSIFHQIANHQLKSRLELANQTAHTAMSDNSDLGANIQFLLAVHDCDNLDELGQLLFRTLGRYGLHCSLQMRSLMGDKDMEAHGMAKDLESQLLTQLAANGRYIDFGNRTIVNFDRVSLLIKNMPINDADKYGAIKDNTFSLLQGLNARIAVLEDKQRLIDEKTALRKLSEDVGLVMVTIKDSYQKVMCDIVDEVENVAELIQGRVPTLALTLENERFLEDIALQAIVQTNRIFNDGLAVDEVFEKLEAAVEKSLTTVDESSHDLKKDKPSESPEKGVQDDASVELF